TGTEVRLSSLTRSGRQAGKLTYGRHDPSVRLESLTSGGILLARVISNTVPFGPMGIRRSPPLRWPVGPMRYCPRWVNPAHRGGRRPPRRSGGPREKCWPDRWPRSLQDRAGQGRAAPSPMLTGTSRLRTMGLERAMLAAGGAVLVRLKWAGVA